MKKAKVAWLRFWRLPFWVSLLLSLSIICWTYSRNARREEACQQQKIELNAIDIESARLGRDIKSYKLKYEALFAKKQRTPAEKARMKVADRELESLDARLKEIERRIHEIRGPEK